MPVSGDLVAILRRWRYTCRVFDKVARPIDGGLGVELDSGCGGRMVGQCIMTIRKYAERSCWARRPHTKAWFFTFLRETGMRSYRGLSSLKAGSAGYPRCRPIPGRPCFPSLRHRAHRTVLKELLDAPMPVAGDPEVDRVDGRWISRGHGPAHPIAQGRIR